MKPSSLLKTIAILIIGSIFFDSCSTSYEARRFSHLDYVKKDKVASANDVSVLNKEDVIPLSKKGSTVLEAPEPDYTASVNEIHYFKTSSVPFVQGKANGLVFSEYSSNQQVDIPNGFWELSKHFVQSKKSEMFKKSSPYDWMNDENKLLFLWLVCIGVAIVFFALAVIAWPFAIIGTLASIAALVFFILWIGALSNG